MKNTVCEMNNTLEGIKSRLDEAEYLISELENKIEKNSQTEQKMEKKTKKVGRQYKGAAGQHEM